MIVRSDHVAGAAFFAAVGIVVFALSGDLPFGSLSSPGAGMMPKLVVGLMMAFGAILVVLGARVSPPFATIDWSDAGMPLRVVAIAACAIRALHDARLHLS